MNINKQGNEDPTVNLAEMRQMQMPTQLKEILQLIWFDLMAFLVQSQLSITNKQHLPMQKSHTIIQSLTITPIAN